MAKNGSTTSKKKRKPVAVQIEGKPRSSSSISGYEGALAYLTDRVDLERIRQTSATKHLYKLDRMRAILSKLGDPQDAIRCIHVAGTKGKGSTCEVTATCLEACGYAVGLFTSPHLVDLRERVRINRKPIPKDEFTTLMKRCEKAATSVKSKHGEATFFEIMTALGFLHFAEQAVDAAVIEVGLGGLLDCTNVITPEVSAITTIGYDHTHILGKKLEEIAAQKAGIFKPAVPALAIQQEHAEVTKTLREAAAKIGAPLQIVGEDIEYSFRFEWQAGAGPHARVCLTTDRSNYEHVSVPLKGEHQAHNCALALAILDKLIERGFSRPENKVMRGLENVKLDGRFEMALSSPRLLLDGAHNPESIKALMKAIGAYLQYDSLIVVFGCAADKDVEGILKNLAAGADKVIFTQASGNARAAKPAELQRIYTDISGKVSQTAPTLREALALAGRAVQRDDLICVTGSFYLIGETKQYLAERTAQKAGAKK